MQQAAFSMEASGTFDVSVIPEGMEQNARIADDKVDTAPECYDCTAEGDPPWSDGYDPIWDADWTNIAGAGPEPEPVQPQEEDAMQLSSAQLLAPPDQGGHPEADAQAVKPRKEADAVQVSPELGAEELQLARTISGSRGHAVEAVKKAEEERLAQEMKARVEEKARKAAEVEECLAQDAKDEKARKTAEDERMLLQIFGPIVHFLWQQWRGQV